MDSTTHILLYREFFYASLIFIFILTTYIFAKLKNIKKMSNKTTEYIAHLNTPLDSNINEVLDNLCNETLNDYLALSAELFNAEYINEETEKKIQHDVLTMLTERISPAFIDRLSIYYNPDNIMDLLARKVVMSVTTYVIGINSVKQQK